jgi:hypothetical protein
MPLELGIDLGCRRYGVGYLRQKKILILDAEKFRYQKFISDISGQDIEAHGNDPEAIIRRIRDWLRSYSNQRRMPGGDYFAQRFNKFSKQLPRLYRKLKLDAGKFNYADFSALVVEWLGQNPGLAWASSQMM